MRYSQLFVLFFLLVHGVASLPTPPPGLLTSARRSQQGSRYQDSTSRGNEDLQSVRSAVLSEVSAPTPRSPSLSGDRPVANSATPSLEEHSITSQEDGRASTSLLPRAPAPAPARPAENWKRPLTGIGILGAALTAIGGLASYKVWRQERDRRRKKEEEERAKAQPPEVQHPMVQAPQDGPWCMGC